jgi:ABC-2 type transport system ATP-binding protein
LSQRLDEIESESVILVEARGPSDQIVQSIKGVGGVATVQAKPMDDGIASFEVRLQDEQAEVREEVSKAIAHKGWPIRRLERKRRRLEDAFFDVLRAQDPLKQPMPAPEPMKTQPKGPVGPPPSPESEAITK